MPRSTKAPLRLVLCLVGCVASAGVIESARAAEAAAATPPTEGVADATTTGVPPEDPTKTLCELIETAATSNGLPIGFFTRLLWKESRFRSDAISPKGAQGIAQFMPGTASERGLDDPFDSASAIPASASFLADLKVRFGNLGLAAAAYNAGADRVREWLEEDGALPFETQDYVFSITGLPADTWADPEPAAAASTTSEVKGCVELAGLLGTETVTLSPAIEIEAATAPWGVQVAGNFSRDRAVAAYLSLQKRFPDLLAERAPMIVSGRMSGRMSGRGPRAFYRVRVPLETKSDAEALCAELKASGGSCIVLRS